MSRSVECLITDRRISKCVFPVDVVVVDGALERNPLVPKTPSDLFLSVSRESLDTLK